MIKSILKGAVIGIANIIPGVSGGTMAVSMGIYDKIIHAVTHLFSEFKKSMKILIPIGIGIVIAIVGVARLIEYMFRVVPLQTNLLFIGLILGGLPAIGKKVKGAGFKVGYVIAFALFFALVVGCAALEGSSGGDVVLTVSLLNAIKLFGVGVIASATMVIPGVSGSMVMMILGYYYAVINTIKGFLDSLKAFDMPGLIHGACLLIPFGIGVLLGIFLIAKLITFLFEKFGIQTYCAILGLIIASPFAIFYNTGLFAQLSSLTIGSVILGIVLAAAGAILTLKMGES